MKSKIKYPFLTGLFALIALAALMFAIHFITGVAAIVIVGLGQLTAVAMSKNRPGVFYISGLTQEQIEEFSGILEGLQKEYPQIKGLVDGVAKMEKDNDDLRSQVNKFKKNGFMSPTGVRWLGDTPFVSNECAAALTSILVLDCARIEGAMKSMVHEESKQQRLIQCAAGHLGVTMRAGGALTPTDIPLPTVYVPQIVELVFAYGAARKYATVFPLGAGTVKLPRLQAGEDSFSFLGAGTAGMSQAIGEKEVTAELITFTANKMGGLIRIPYELEEDTFIPIGQFLARYIARQFAKMEDSTLFLADGSAGYANIIGLDKYCTTPVAGATPYLATLAAGQTAPSDVTLVALRNMRGLVNPAILANMSASGQTMAAYYFHPSFEPLLRSFNQYPNFVVFTNENGKPTFDGWPVRWIGVGQPYSTAAAAATTLARFGDLSYWYLGERGEPRVEVSKEVFFQTDEIAMRALERIDVEGMAVDAMSILQTAAA
jgi:HK97 family phage major capsid protein